MNNFRHTSFILLIFIALSCSTSKEIKKTTIPDIVVTPPIAEVTQTDSIIEKMTASQFNFEWFSAKFSADYEIDNNNTSFSGQIRIRKDSIIWISISKFSIEGARILITQDSIFVVNRLDNNYFKSDFNYINRFINNAIDFDMLQALVLGNDLKYYENDKFKSNYENGFISLNTVNRHKLKKYIKNENDKLKILVQNILVDPETYKIKNLTVKEVKENNKLKINYDNFEFIEKQLFPKLLHVSIISEKQINITIEYSKIYINESLNFPFKIPEGYERIIPK